MAVISVIKLSELEGAKRLDAEYYQPEYLNLISKIKSQKSKSISELVSDIRYGLYVEPEYLEKGVNFIRALNLLNFWIEGEILKIDERKIPPGYRLKTGDVLIVRSGANTGCVSIVYPRFEGATFGSYTIRLRFNKVNPFFAAIFLNTKLGTLQTQRLQTGMAQPNLNIPNIKEIRIPTISEEKQKEVEILCKKIEEERANSENLYSQAESLLLSELGLQDFKPKEELFYKVSLSEANTAHRIDAEYFNPIYDEIMERINNKKVEMKPLNKFLISVKKGIEVGSEKYQEEGMPFIRVSNISIHGLIDKDQKFIDEKDYNILKDKFEPTEGEILLTKDATPGIAYFVKEPIKGIISSGILRLKVKDINPEYLCLCINSIIGKSQIERDSGGSVITHWKPNQIKSLQIPILPKPTQQKIAELVQKSHEARRKAKQLLEEAKKKVEEAIEKQNN